MPPSETPRVVHAAAELQRTMPVGRIPAAVDQSIQQIHSVLRSSGTVTLILALWLCACAEIDGPGTVATSSVTGTVGFMEAMVLPSGTLLTVRLVDVSRADAAATVLGEQIMQVDGRQPPFGFAIPYDPAGIDERYAYSVQARIEVDGKLRFISDRFYPVITRGAPRQVDLVLKAVGNPTPWLRCRASQLTLY